jgi:hypothetical protein
MWIVDVEGHQVGDLWVIDADDHGRWLSTSHTRRVLQPQRCGQQPDHHVPPGAATADRQAERHHCRHGDQQQLSQQRDGDPAAPQRRRHLGAGRPDHAAGEPPTCGGADQEHQQRHGGCQHPAPAASWRAPPGIPRSSGGV